MKIGFIGYRNHALKLLKLTDKLELKKSFLIYYPDSEKLKSQFDSHSISSPSVLTSNFEDLQTTDVIFIASPTSTHFEYLRKLSRFYNGYIFCEKPPCGSVNDLQELSSFDDKIKQRIFFNFCYRYSAFATTCKRIVSNNEFGVPISLTFRSSHGIAFKDFYKENWRNTSALPLDNILGNIGVHYVDLTSYLLGGVNDISFSATSVAPNTKYQDSIQIQIKRKSGLPVSVFLSYACPHDEFAQLIFSDGIVEFQNGVLTTRSPRDTFNTDGFFTSPPIKSTTSFASSVDYYDKAIANSLTEFFYMVEKSSKIPLDLFDSAIHSTQIILNCVDNKKSL